MLYDVLTTRVVRCTALRCDVGCIVFGCGPAAPKNSSTAWLVAGRIFLYHLRMSSCVDSIEGRATKKMANIAPN